MSDTKLRDLERRWKECGSPDDEAAYLLERVRVGDLSREMLELAAHCGHVGAKRALGADGPLGPECFRGWFLDLERWQKPVLVRAAVAAASFSLSRWTQGEVDPDVRAAVIAAETWLGCPCEEHVLAAAEAAETARFVAVEARDTHGVDGERRLKAASFAARAAADQPGEWTEHVALAPAWMAAYSAAGGDPYAMLEDWHLARTREQWERVFRKEPPPAPSARETLEAIRAALIGFALQSTTSVKA